MELFNKAKAVRLRSHLGKYLVADEDEETVRQSRNGSSRNARWAVEIVAGKTHFIRLKSCHGRYLAASDEAFLLGMTGKKVVQYFPASKNDISVEWEPIKEGSLVMLRTKSSGKFLRANGGTPPWRNSVTHDVPNRTATQEWVLWEVEIVDIPLSDSDVSYLSPALSFSSCPDEFTGSNTMNSQLSSMVGSNGSGHSSFSSVSNDDFSASSKRSKSRLSSMVSSGSANGSFCSLPDEVSSSASNNRQLSTLSSSRARSSFANQSGIEFFRRAKAVRLQSHLGKYLVADEEEEAVRQSRNGSSHKARWIVEFVEGKNKAIRLKSFHGKYLTATDDPFLFGMTGKKVVQTGPATKMDSSVEWEPIKEGVFVKLMTREGKFLRANGGTPPWRNSVTHDIPHRTATQDWVLWGVDVVDITLEDSDTLSRNVSSVSSFSSSTDDFAGSPETGSPMGDSGTLAASGTTSKQVSSARQSGGMDLFQKAKTVRLRSHHDKYLLAEDDQETVCQDRNGTCKAAKWTVEFVDGFHTVIRLKSCYGKYLTAADDQYLLGVTGRKVLQTVPARLDSKVEWEPIRDGFQVRLKTRYGHYLRANGGLPPWRNSITHDIPHRHTDWILWEVDIVEVRPPSPPREPPPPPERLDSIDDSDEPSFRLRSPTLVNPESVGSPAKSEGRMICYSVADDYGKTDEGVVGTSFQFKGHNLEKLTQKLEEETGLEDIIVCSRNPLNGKLYPLRLALPPNNATMHIVVVPASSRVARDFVPETSSSS